jgi:hypothetical protein
MCFEKTSITGKFNSILKLCRELVSYVLVIKEKTVICDTDFKLILFALKDDYFSV